MWSKRFEQIIEKLVPLKASLRIRVAFGVALPVFLVLISLSVLHYRRGYQLVTEQAQRSAVRFGDMMISSLNHAMLLKEGQHLVTALDDLSRLEQVDKIEIIGISGKILASSGEEGENQVFKFNDPECQVCHQYPPETRPRVVELGGTGQIMRVSAPVDNQPECYACHAESNSHLGILLIDLSLRGERETLKASLKTDLIVSTGITLLLSLGIYWLIHLFVVRRIDALREPLAAYTAGDLSARFTCQSSVVDELYELGDTFNHMADEIDRYVREREERSQVREQAISEERERIARELHDGMAQVLGFVNTKAMAARLMLQRGQVEVADQYLHQLEEAARGLSMDIREAILGLKIAGEAGTSLGVALESYLDQFRQLNNLTVIVDLEPGIKNLDLTAETEFHLVRIVQEAFTNIRKHANANHAWLKVSLSDGRILKLMIRDDGRGFDIEKLPQKDRDHFGLVMMRERSQQIGASFDLASMMGEGTRILVQLNLNGKS